MRLNYNYFKWSPKTRCLTGAFIWLFIAIVSFFCSPTGTALIKWTKDIGQVALQKTNTNLRQVEVIWQNNSHYTKTEEIFDIIGLKQGENMQKLSIKSIQEKIEQLPWVRHAIIERYWPNTLKITIEEKMPLALWQNKHKYHPLDEEGHVINTTKQLPADLLLVVGPDAPQQLIPLIQDLEKVPEIYQYVRAAVRMGERRWNLKLFDAEKGLEILLPENNTLDALKRLNEHNKKEKLIKRQVAAIDLRTKEKVILKPIPTPKQKPKAIKK